MEKVIFSNNGGMGIVLEKNDIESDYILPENITLSGSGNLTPGCMTTLSNIFTHPVKYCGLLIDNEHKIMVFYLGENSDLFSDLRYYNCFYFITENRIANKYREHTVRDFNWVNDRWK